MAQKRFAVVDQKQCVACGVCAKACPKNAISIFKGMFATVDLEKCIGCTKCEKLCPASVISMEVCS